MENKIKVVATAQNQAALGVIKAYLTIYPNTTLTQLKEKFPNDIAPDKGVAQLFVTEQEFSEINENANIILYFTKDSQLIDLSDGEKIALSYIWTKSSLHNLLSRVTIDGIELEMITPSEANERNIEGFELELLNGFNPSCQKGTNRKQALALGESTEMLIISRLLDEGREVWLPTVDDHGVDLLVKTRNVRQGDRTKAEHYDFQEIQIKSVKEGGLFAAMRINPRPNYWFVFYIKNIDKMWLINSVDLVNSKRLYPQLKPGNPRYLATSQNKNPKMKNIKNFGLWSLDLTPTNRTPIKSEDFVVDNFALIP